jgi:hypothetical protein
MSLLNRIKSALGAKRSKTTDPRPPSDAPPAPDRPPATGSVVAGKASAIGSQPPKPT